jgi:hypothetical protein
MYIHELWRTDPGLAGFDVEMPVFRVVKRLVDPATPEQHFGDARLNLDILGTTTLHLSLEKQIVRIVR